MTYDMQARFRKHLQAIGIPARHIYGERITTSPPETGGGYPISDFGLVVYTCKLAGRDWWALWTEEEAKEFFASYRAADDAARVYLRDR